MRDVAVLLAAEVTLVLLLNILCFLYVIGFYCTMLCSVYLSVHPSVTFINSLEMNKHIFKFFHHHVATPF